jgi:hypothetical protein
VLLKKPGIFLSSFHTLDLGFHACPAWLAVFMAKPGIILCEKNFPIKEAGSTAIQGNLSLRRDAMDGVVLSVCDFHFAIYTPKL